MILMRARRAEKRHDTIALYLVDDAVVSMHGILHETYHGLQAKHGRLGITQTVNKARRITNVGEQNRETFVFASAGAELTKQLAQVRWLRWLGSDVAQRTAAMAAKATVRPTPAAAGSAYQVEQRPT